MKRGRKATTCQKKFRKTLFPYHQYWIVYFTEKYSDNSEKDFVTFIKAKSYDLAKSILKRRVLEQDKSIKLKSVLGYLLHSNYKNTYTGDKLSLKDWDNVKKSAFPNINNFLFKKEITRPEGYTCRFNKVDRDQVKKVGFKKGAENWSTKNRKGKFKKLHERKGLRWNGYDWVKWDKEEMNHTKHKIIHALITNNNNRKLAAESLNIGRGTLYKLMARCETKDWWNSNYPIEKRIPPRVSKEQRSATQKRVMAERMASGIKPFSCSSKEIEEKRLSNLRASKAKERDEYRKSLIPKIKKALSENNNIRTAAARSLGVKRGTLKAWMLRTKEWVNWSEEYPSNYNTNKDFRWNKVNK